MKIIFLFILFLCFNSTLHAQAVLYYHNYGVSTGSLSSGTGTNQLILGGTTQNGTLFYGFSSGANATLTGANPGLLHLGTNTEAQCSAGNGASELSKFGVMNIAAPSNNTVMYNKFSAIFGGSGGTTYTNSGEWYFFAGYGGASGKFMYNNTLGKNLLETAVAIRFSNGDNGALTLSYYSYLTSTTGEWITIPGTYYQTRKYQIETYCNKSLSFNYVKNGTSYILAANTVDIWINNVLVIDGGHIASTNFALQAVNSWCFYGEESNSGYIFTDDAYYTNYPVETSSTIYYSKSTGNLNTLSTWGTSADGSGTSPMNFTKDYCEYIICNNSTPTIGDNWTVSGVNSRIIVGDGASACNLTIPSSYTYTGIVDVENYSTLTLQNATPPTFGFLYDGSTVNYSISGAQNIDYPLFYNLKTSGTGTKTLATNVRALGTVTAGDGINSGTLLIPSSYSLTGTVNVNANATLSIRNSTNPTLGTIGAGSTVSYALASDGQSVLAANYVNLTFSNYKKTLPVSGTIGISGTFTQGSATGHTITGSTINFNGSGTQSIPAFKYNNLTISNIGSNIRLPSSDTVFIAGTFTPGSTSFGTITGSTVEFNGTSSQSLSAFTFNNLTVDNSAGITLTGACTINGALNFQNGVFRAVNYPVYFGTSATHTKESNTSYIRGIAIMNSRNVGTGTLNFLNCYIQGSVNIGYVTITRTSGTQGVVTVGANSSTACNWDISTSVTMSGKRAVSFSWPSVWDNGISFSSTNKGQVWYYNDGNSLWDTAGVAADVSGTDPREITPTLWHFSKYVVTSENKPMPVELTSFTSTVNIRDTRLNWITDSENNNAGFEVYKSSTNDENNWQIIGYIKGMGTKTTPTAYTFEDKKLNTGKYKYRLKQIDNNGNFEYYNLAGVIEIGVPKAYTLTQNYPNPFNPGTKIDFELPYNSRVKLIVYDISGKEVKTLLNNEQRQPGYHTVEFNAKDLASGIYVYRLIANANGDDVVYTKKMVLVK